MNSNIAGIDFDHDPHAAAGFASVVIRPLGFAAGFARYKVGAGRYRFSAPNSLH